jgi:hypothetical protein
VRLRRFFQAVNQLLLYMAYIKNICLEASEEILYENFVAHAKKVFPHLNCLGDLKIISDLTMPHNWYPVARTLKRRFIYHAGMCRKTCVQKLKTDHSISFFKERYKKRVAHVAQCNWSFTH